MDDLKHFESGIVGSEQIWFAAIGPGIKASGLTATPIEVKQDQVAATVLSLLGEQGSAFSPKAGKAIDVILTDNSYSE